MIQITVSEEIVLRSFANEDAALLFATVNGSRQHLRKWLAWVDATTKMEHSLQFIKNSRQRINNQEAIDLGIYVNGVLCGCIGMYAWDRHLKKAEIGYWLANDMQGKGVITTCLKVFINWLFQQLKLNKIEIHFAAGNHKSAAVTKRVNAVIEGIIRDGMLINGQFENKVVSGILVKDWKA